MNEKQWEPPILSDEFVHEMPECNDPFLLMNWYEFNDGSVKPTNATSITHAYGDGKNASNAYILIYA